MGNEYEIIGSNELDSMNRNLTKNSIVSFSKEFYPFVTSLGEAFIYKENKKCEILFSKREYYEQYKEIFKDAHFYYVPSISKIKKWYKTSKYRMMDNNDYKYVFLIDLSSNSLEYLFNQWFGDRMNRQLAFKFINFTKHNLKGFTLKIDPFVQRHFNRYDIHPIRDYNMLSEEKQQDVVETITNDIIIPYIMKLKNSRTKFGFQTTVDQINMKREIKDVEKSFNEIYGGNSKIPKNTKEILVRYGKPGDTVELYELQNKESHKSHNNEINCNPMDWYNGKITFSHLAYSWYTRAKWLSLVIVLLLIYFYFNGKYEQSMKTYKNIIYKEYSSEESFDTLKERLDNYDVDYNKKDERELYQDLLNKYDDIKNMWFWHRNNLVRNLLVLKHTNNQH